MEINGKKVVDATKPISIHITKRDATDGANKDPAACAAARAVKRDVPECINARVHIGRVYVETKTKWLRYDTPDSLRTEIIAFDRGGEFQPGDYKLGAPAPRKAHDGSVGQSGARKNPSRKRRKVLMAKVKRHEVTGIRPKGANR